MIPTKQAVINNIIIILIHLELEMTFTSKNELSFTLLNILMNAVRTGTISERLNLEIIIFIFLRKTFFVIICSIYLFTNHINYELHYPVVTSMYTSLSHETTLTLSKAHFRLIQCKSNKGERSPCCLSLCLLIAASPNPLSNKN